MRLNRDSSGGGPPGISRSLILLGFTQDTDFVGPLTASQDFPVNGPIFNLICRRMLPLGFTLSCIRAIKYSTKFFFIKYEVVPHNYEQQSMAIDRWLLVYQRLIEPLRVFFFFFLLVSFFF